MKKDTGVVVIHGKEYETVASRVQKFREEHGTTYAILTDLIDRDEQTVVIKATIQDKDGFIIATGYAEEDRNASRINKTSALENCETSAIGRALANFGFAGTEYASADEVANAISNQATQAERPATDKQKRFMKDLFDQKRPAQDFVKWLQDEMGFGDLANLTAEQASSAIEELQA